MRICVFCSSSAAVGAEYFAAAEETGRRIGEGGHELVYGGGRMGLMGAAARAARAAGARVTGIIPAFMNRPGIPYEGCHDLVVTRDMAERKARMRECGEAFIALAGGFGTLEELSEVITQKQFDILRAPLVAVSTRGFYAPLAAFFESFYSLRFAKADYRAACPFVATPAEAMDYVASWTPPPSVSKWFT